MAVRKELPPFSGDDVPCPKCGQEGASTLYLGHGACIHGPAPMVVGYEPNERLHRECRCCDFTWDEAVLADSILDEWT